MFILGFLHLITPAIMRKIEDSESSIEIKTYALQALRKVAIKVKSFGDSISGVLHPIARVISKSEVSSEICKEAITTLCILISRLGIDYVYFIPTFNKIMKKKGIKEYAYEQLISKLLKNEYNREIPIGGLRPSFKINRKLSTSNKTLNVNGDILIKACDPNNRSSEDDWSEWIVKLSLELVAQSPSPEIRSVQELAKMHNPLAQDLMNTAFYSCWREVNPKIQSSIEGNLRCALENSNITNDVLTSLLNVAEWMEHCDKPLHIEANVLGGISTKVSAFAKALHYKEIEFRQNPQNTIEDLIGIYNVLQQPEAATGLLSYSEREYKIQIKERWCEKLGRWEDALHAYENNNEEGVDVESGKMRCLYALGRWEELSELVKKRWSRDEETRQSTCLFAAASAWKLGNWEEFKDYLEVAGEEGRDAMFYRSILSVHNQDWKEALNYIDKTRNLLDNELTTLVGESYSRAYNLIVLSQQLSEMEEVIEFYTSDEERKNVIISSWNKRLKGSQRNLEVWKNILSVRSFAINQHDDSKTWISFSNLYKKEGKYDLASEVLKKILGDKKNKEEVYKEYPNVMFAQIKLEYSTIKEENKSAPMNKLKDLLNFLEKNTNSERKGTEKLIASCHLKLSKWKKESIENKQNINEYKDSLHHCQKSIEYRAEWYNAWHVWSLLNFEISTISEGISPSIIQKHVIQAIKGFFRSIALEPSYSLQNTLRLLTLWFIHGANASVVDVLQEGFNSVTIDNWLQVIPQLIARIHSPILEVKRLVQQLLSTVGKAHPQALVYPMTVVSKSLDEKRVVAAESIINEMRSINAKLVNQAYLVSNELIKCSILWHESWSEALQEASIAYFDHHDVEKFISLLEPLHKLIENPVSIREISFQQTYGRDLKEAHEWCEKYKQSGDKQHINQAWDLYYWVFQRLKKQILQMNVLELKYISSALKEAKDLVLAVPGLYQASSNNSVVCIQSFDQEFKGKKKKIYYYFIIY